MPRTMVHPDRTAPEFSPEFRCTFRHGGRDVAWVRAAGELDIAAAPELVRTLGLVEDRARRVVLDLRELTFIDAFGVHVIVDADERARSIGRQLLLVRGPSQVDRMLALTRAHERLTMVHLNPAEPPVQALVQIAARERAHERRWRTASG
ncbi:MAG TPA: STAS domain-containing protein [Solirubrobacteraceae bacterium]|nr:STAS domain-containing protein [Solirubrobacteraceae bacterium]